MHFNLTSIKVLLLGISMTLGFSLTAQNISLQISDSSIDENGGEATVTLAPNHINTGPEDYNLTSEAITIEAGSLPGSTTLIGVADDTYEGDEKVRVSIVAIAGGSATFDGDESVIINTGNDIAKQENQPPLPTNDEFEVEHNTKLTGSSLVSIDSDTDANKLKINTIPVIYPSNGSLVINEDGTFTYTPDDGFFGTDSFTYEVCDNSTPPLCSTAMVNINVKKATSGHEVRDGFSPEHGNYIIPWLNKYDKVSLVVYNRWGNIVYKQKKYENNWYGESNEGLRIGNKLPAGTYYYVITIVDNNNRLTGYIYLTR